jgi:hypothetical protein
LVQQKIRLPPPRKGKPLVRLQCAPLEDVRKFEDDQIGGPDKVDILIAWHQSLASPWNRDAITLIAEEALKYLKTSETKYDESWLEIPELIKQITVSLKTTKKIMNSSSASSKDGPRQRRRSRKIAVSKIVW